MKNKQAKKEYLQYKLKKNAVEDGTYNNMSGELRQE